MLRKIAWVFAALILVVGGYVAYLMITSRNLSPADKAEYSSGGFTVQVNYSRPAKRGRLIFGEEKDGALVPYGKKWRTGANEATEISISKDILLEGTSLKAGRYSLYTIPGPDEWTIVFNSKLDYWGAQLTGDPFEENLDVLRVQAKVSENDAEVEQFTISFTPADSVLNLNFFWDKTRVTLPMVPVD
jgi:hypothetical protein